MRWLNFEGGLTEIGYSSNVEDLLDFCFENETPRHRVYLDPFQIANREVTCREYLEFMLDDGYMRSGLWLSDGWEKVKEAGWEAPLYWERDSSDEMGWRIFTLRGWFGLSVLLDTPVCHISFFEADAFARWRGCRLPTEAEWESCRGMCRRRGIYSTRADCILQRRTGMELSNSLATLGSGPPALTSAIQGTSRSPVRWANTTANSCPAR